MDSQAERVDITLEGPLAERLIVLASRMDVHEGILGRSLLSQALADLDTQEWGIVEVLDGLPGAS